MLAIAGNDKSVSATTGKDVRANVQVYHIHSPKDVLRITTEGQAAVIEELISNPKAAEKFRAECKITGLLGSAKGRVTTV